MKLSNSNDRTKMLRFLRVNLDILNRNKNQSIKNMKKKYFSTNRENRKEKYNLFTINKKIDKKIFLKSMKKRQFNYTEEIAEIVNMIDFKNKNNFDEKKILDKLFLFLNDNFGSIPCFSKIIGFLKYLIFFDQKKKGFVFEKKIMVKNNQDIFFKNVLKKINKFFKEKNFDTKNGNKLSPKIYVYKKYCDNMKKKKDFFEKENLKLKKKNEIFKNIKIENFEKTKELLETRLNFLKLKKKMKDINNEFEILSKIQNNFENYKILNETEKLQLRREIMILKKEKNFEFEKKENEKKIFLEKKKNNLLINKKNINIKKKIILLLKEIKKSKIIYKKKFSEIFLKKKIDKKKEGRLTEKNIGFLDLDKKRNTTNSLFKNQNRKKSVFLRKTTFYNYNNKKKDNFENNKKYSKRKSFFKKIDVFENNKKKIKIENNSNLKNIENQNKSEKQNFKNIFNNEEKNNENFFFQIYDEFVKEKGICSDILFYLLNIIKMDFFGSIDSHKKFINDIFDTYENF